MDECEYPSMSVSTWVCDEGPWSDGLLGVLLSRVGECSFYPIPAQTSGAESVTGGPRTPRLPVGSGSVTHLDRVTPV